MRRSRRMLFEGKILNLSINFKKVDQKFVLQGNFIHFLKICTID